MHPIQDAFLSYLKPGARILDFGCGSGRDTKYFLEHGFEVDAIDGSERLCALAGKLTGIPVKQMLFEDLDAMDVYDGIWACASVLHLEYEPLTKGKAVKIMSIVIRKMLPEEYPLLSDFLYEAIFQRDETNLLPRSVIDDPALRVYIEDFGSKDDDICFCAVNDDKPVGAAWVRNISGYGNIGAQTPELAISMYKEFRGKGIGTAMLEALLEYMKCAGYEKLSLSELWEKAGLKKVVDAIAASDTLFHMAEDYGSACSRMKAALDQVVSDLQACGGENPMVVTSGMSLNFLIERLGFSMSGPIENCSVTTVVWENGAYTITTQGG